VETENPKFTTAIQNRVRCWGNKLVNVKVLCVVFDNYFIHEHSSYTIVLRSCTQFCVLELERLNKFISRG